MKILLLGSGGRESTLAWKLSQSPQCEKLFIAPGNGGTLQYGENVKLNPTDFPAVAHFCKTEKIDILFPGNEDPLVLGIWDFFKNDKALEHIIIAGPSKDGAILEGSKDFSKDFMKRYQIPTADYATFSAENYQEGLEYIKNHSLPIVLKADGLAAGKGVIIAQSIEEALAAYEDMLQNAAFGKAGERVVIESFLDGIEVSVFVFTDGENYLLLPEAKDYKRIYEGDKGPNTGGMGAVSPVPFFNEDFKAKVINKIIEPTINGLKKEGRIYQGFIFFGLINVKNEPFVIEYNCRLGDPETEVVIPRIKNDLVSLILKMNDGKLNEVQMKVEEKSACTVMLVSDGYPNEYAKGKIIQLPNDKEDSIIFHAGTIKKEEYMLTNGGRVMAITSYGDTIKESLEKSYKKAEDISFEGKRFRRDIGYEFIND